MKLKIPLFVCLLFIFQVQALGQFIGLGLIDLKFKSVRASHKIKTIRVFSSNQQKKGQFMYTLVREADFNPEGQIVKYVWHLPNIMASHYQDGKEIHLYEYDQKGRIVKYIEKNEFKNAELNRLRHYLTYAYNEQDQIINTFYHRPDGTVYKKDAAAGDTTLTYAYGKKNKVETKPKPIVTFDSLTNQYIYREYNTKQKLTLEKTLQLDQEKRITQIKMVYYPSRSVFITNIRYDYNGNEVERTETSKSGKIRNRYFNSFNQEGLITQTSWTAEKNELIQLIKYEYDYY